MPRQTLVVYDSNFGNTRHVAEVIAEKINCRSVSVNAIQLSDLNEKRLLILGSPTLGGQPTAPLQTFIKKIPAAALSGLEVTAFDTRLEETSQNLALRLLMKTIGYAAPKLISGLSSRGAHIAASPIGFIVTGKQGPLLAGELDRAAAWASGLN
jgi:flavodoxin